MMLSAAVFTTDVGVGELLRAHARHLYAAVL